MAVMMDYILSGFIFGILALTMARIQMNINASLYNNTYNIIVQRNAAQLALQIEHDFLKIGYRVHPDSGQVTYADQKSIIFRSDLNRTGSIKMVKYLKGDSTQMTSTVNVHDFALGRYEGASPVPASIPQQNWGLTRFSIEYYDSLMNTLSVPLSAANLKKINAIQVSFVIQSTEPVLTWYDTTWPAVTWQKLMYPRNLNNLQ